MTELAALNIKITGDSTDLKAAIAAANGDLAKLVAGAEAAGLKVSKIPFKPAQDGANGFANTMRGVSQQLSQVGQQTMATGNFLQALAIQLPDIGVGFGAVGAAAGLLAGIALPFLAAAFMDNADNAKEFTSALDELTAATEAFRISAQAIRLGIDEREVLIVEELARATAKVTAEQQRLAANRGSQAAVDAARAEVVELQRKLDLYRQARESEATAVNNADKLRSAMVRAYQVYASTRMEAAGLADETARAASAFSQMQYQKELSMTGQSSGPDAARSISQFGGPVAMRPSGAGMAYVPPAGVSGGSAAANQLQTELEALQESLMTQEQLQMESYTRQQETLKAALDQRLVTQQEYQTLMEAVSAQHFKAMADGSANGATQILGALGTLFEGNKKVGAGIALVNTMIGASEELKKGTFGIASAIRVIAQGMGFVRAIKSASSTGASSAGTGATAAAAAPPQQNVQTLNFTLTNDSFGIGQNLVRQIAAQLNEAQRNGSTLVRATVS